MQWTGSNTGTLRRGYYMAMQRYQKIFHEWAQWMSEIFFQHKKRNFVSPSSLVMVYLLYIYKHQWNIQPFYVNSFFGVKGTIYYIAIAKVIFSHVKITCYFLMWWSYQVFAQKLTWYFIGVYIINTITTLIVDDVLTVSIILLMRVYENWCT